MNNQASLFILLTAEQDLRKKQKSPVSPAHVVKELKWDHKVCAVGMLAYQLSAGREIRMSTGSQSCCKNQCFFFLKKLSKKILN